MSSIKLHINMKPIITYLMMTTIVYTSFTVTEVNSKRKRPTSSIHSSMVPTDVWISSCAVVEDNVPVCQDPEETDEISFLIMNRMGRTPYPDTGFDDDAITTTTTENQRPKDNRWLVEENRSDTANRDTEMRQWSWWKYYSELKQKLPDRPAVQETSLQTTAIQRDESSWRKTMITYSLRGCSPTKVPFNLSPCSSTQDAGQPILRNTETEENRIVTSTRVVYYVPPPSID